MASLEEDMTKNCVYSIPCRCNREQKHKLSYTSLKVRVEGHQKAVVWCEALKLNMTDYLKRECTFGMKSG